MNRTRKALTGAAALAVLIAGCTSAAHLKALQPPAVPPAHPAVLHRQVARPRMRLGIDVDAYTYRGQDVTKAAAATIAYVKSLHANAVSITIPFFVAGRAAHGVYATTETLSPSQVALIADDASRAGLYVTLRPLLDEGNLGKLRTQWHPHFPRQWFASYRRFLLPYAAAAQKARIGEFIVGTEFTTFATSPLWNGLDAALRRHYHGKLAFANNWWGHPQFTGAGGRDVRENVDAYPPIPGHLMRGWRRYDATLPPRMVESEVGIAAVRGAFSQPWRHHWTVTYLDSAVQAQWFTAACHAAAVMHLGGIYFWSVGLSQQPRSGPTMTNQLGWAAGRGARAISRCFASIARHGK